MPKPAAAHFGNFYTKRRNDRCNDKTRFIAYTARGMFIHTQPLDIGKIQPFPRIAHGKGERRRFFQVHTAEINRHTQRRHLIIGDFAVSIAFNYPLDFRFGLSSVPDWLVALSSVLFILGYIMYAEVMRENAYLSRTVEIQKDQKVISSGLYGIVRHPMYLATLLMFLPMPLILGSFYGLIPFVIYPIAIVIRILNEEKVLTEGLCGYSEYKTKVKYRLIPFIW